MSPVLSQAERAPVVSVVFHDECRPHHQVIVGGDYAGAVFPQPDGSFAAYRLGLRVATGTDLQATVAQLVEVTR